MAKKTQNPQLLENNAPVLRNDQFRVEFLTDFPLKGEEVISTGLPFYTYYTKTNPCAVAEFDIRFMDCGRNQQLFEFINLNKVVTIQITRYIGKIGMGAIREVWLLKDCCIDSNDSIQTRLLERDSTSDSHIQIPFTVLKSNLSVSSSIG